MIVHNVLDSFAQYCLSLARVKTWVLDYYVRTTTLVCDLHDLDLAMGTATALPLQFRASLELIRWQITGIAAVATFLSAIDAGVQESLAATAVVTLICAGGFAFNDVCDWQIDRISSPHRPIPSGRMSRTHALVLAISLLALGNVFAVLQDPIQRIVAALVTVTLILYSLVLKKFGLLGNVATAIMCATVFLYVGATRSDFTGYLGLSSVVLLFVLGRELVIDVAHADGDLAHGRRTLPSMWSGTATLRLAQVLMLAAGALAVILGTSNSAQRSALVAVGAIIVVEAGFRFPRVSGKQEIERFIRQDRLAILLAIVAWWLASL